VQRKIVIIGAAAREDVPEFRATDLVADERQAKPQFLALD